LNLHPTKFSNSKNALYFGNENPEFKMLHSKKVDPKDIIVFPKKIKILLWIKIFQIKNNTF